MIAKLSSFRFMYSRRNGEREGRKEGRQISRFLKNGETTELPREAVTSTKGY